MKYSTPIVDVHLNNHCNLACVGCNHFSDLTDYKTPQISDDNLFETLNLVSQKIECTTQLSLLGGEPLLRKNFKQLLVTCLTILKKNNFDMSKVRLYSNGLLLHKHLYLKDILDEYKIKLFISFHPNEQSKFREPLFKNLRMFLGQWKGKARPVEVFHSKHFKKQYRESKGKIYPYKSNDIKSSYENCSCPNTQAYNMKLYKCAPIAYLPFALKRTGQLKEPWWKKYLEYTPASLYDDSELSEFFNVQHQSEQICSMCPSEPVWVQKIDRSQL